MFSQARPVALNANRFLCAVEMHINKILSFVSLHRVWQPMVGSHQS
jgi:hypothetical protein